MHIQSEILLDPSNDLSIFPVYVRIVIHYDVFMGKIPTIGSFALIYPHHPNTLSGLVSTIINIKK